MPAICNEETSDLCINRLCFSETSEIKENKADDYNKLMQKMLNNFYHLLDRYLEITGNTSEDQQEKFHQNIKVIIRKKYDRKLQLVSQKESLPSQL